MKVAFYSSSSALRFHSAKPFKACSSTKKNLSLIQGGKDLKSAETPVTQESGIKYLDKIMSTLPPKELRLWREFDGFLSLRQDDNNNDNDNSLSWLRRSLPVHEIAEREQEKLAVPHRLEWGLPSFT